MSQKSSLLEESIKRGKHKQKALINTRKNVLTLNEYPKTSFGGVEFIPQDNGDYINLFDIKGNEL